MAPGLPRGILAARKFPFLLPLCKTGVQDADRDVASVSERQLTGRGIV